MPLQSLRFVIGIVGCNWWIILDEAHCVRSRKNVLVRPETTKDFRFLVSESKVP